MRWWNPGATWGWHCCHCSLRGRGVHQHEEQTYTALVIQRPWTRSVQSPPLYPQGNWDMQCPWDLFVCEFLPRIPTNLEFPGLLSSTKFPRCEKCNLKCSLLCLSTCTLSTNCVWKHVCAGGQGISYCWWEDTQQSTLLCNLWGGILLEVTKPSNSQVLQHKKEPLVWNVSRRALVQVEAGSAEWNSVNLGRRKGP